MTGALGGAVIETTEEPRDGAEVASLALDPGNSRMDAEVAEEPCQRCGDGPREELVEITMRDCIAIFEVCRPCARRLTDTLRGGA